MVGLVAAIVGVVFNILIAVAELVNANESIKKVLLCSCCISWILSSFCWFLVLFPNWVKGH